MSGAEASLPMPMARSRAPLRLLRTILLYSTLPILLLTVWQLASSTGLLPDYLLPSPADVLRGFVEITLDGTLEADLWASAKRSITGFLLATVLAVPLGIAIGWFRGVRKSTYFTLLLLMPIPITAWISVAIVWFGIGDRSAIFLVTLGAAVPILINTIHGVEWVDKLYVEAALTLGTGPRSILWRIVLPAALPNILTGLRLGLRNSWAGLVVAEMIGARSGVGYLIWDARLLMRSDLLVTGMLIVGVLGSTSDYAMALLSKRLLHWRGTDEHGN